MAREKPKRIAIVSNSVELARRYFEREILKSETPLKSIDPHMAKDVNGDIYYFFGDSNPEKFRGHRLDTAYCSYNVSGYFLKHVIAPVLMVKSGKVDIRFFRD